MHIYDGMGRGSLPPVVLLHGIGASGTSFSELALRLLPHTKRLIIPDLVGHGFSPSPKTAVSYQDTFDATAHALEAILDEPAVVFGNSLGGANALSLSLLAPSLVRGLILSSPAGAPFSPQELAGVREAFDISTREKALAFLDRIYHRTPWYARFIAHELCRIYQSKTVVEIFDSLQAGDSINLHDLQALTQPILLIWGKDERLLPRTHLAYFRKHLPQHTLIEEPENTGHAPHLESALGVAARIVTFSETHWGDMTPAPDSGQGDPVFAG